MNETEFVFVDVNDLWKFLDKEGVEAYNSLVMSNNIQSNGLIGGFQITVKR